MAPRSLYGHDDNAHSPGEPVAFVGATRWYIARWIVDLPLDDRDRRALIVLCQTLVDESA